jgi:DNA (cytosine-5)-methyltransferase 1
MNVVKVVELFAGVGGFRLGFENLNSEAGDEHFQIVWSNQWEPSTKTQHASEIYRKRWKLTESIGEDIYSDIDGSDLHSNQDINTLSAKDIPDHDLLVGGFPCQDYSVAKTLNKSDGIVGKKGVLWWDIHRILKEKNPAFVLLENVDRLLKSPTSQRGRDFAIMLSALHEIGYDVEWRVIRASDYGMPQRRTRVFIIGMKRGTKLNQNLRASESPEYWLQKGGLFAKAFPVRQINQQTTLLPLEIEMNKLLEKEDYTLHDLSNDFNSDGKATPFHNAGVVIDGEFFTRKLESRYSGKKTNLGDILLSPSKIPEEYMLSANDLLREKGWIYQKGAKKEPRKGRDGFTYQYSEGPVTFPDSKIKPSRTIITGEGGSGASRFKHVVIFKPTKKQRQLLEEQNKEELAQCRTKLSLKANEWVRRLHPIELERLNMMPDNHTLGLSDSKRAFMMGNALVVGIITRIGEILIEEIP